MTHIDFIVTGVKTPFRGREAVAALSQYASKLEHNITFRVLYYATDMVDVERSGVCELDWLLFNAARGPFICHIDIANLSRVRARTVNMLSTFIHEHVARSRTAPDGRVKFPEEFPGCEALYYATHNKHRMLRFMDGAFPGRKPRIAIMVPMTLKGFQVSKTLPFMESLAPSLEKTFSHVQMDRGVYVGIDEDEEIPAKTLRLIENRVARHLDTATFEGFYRIPAAYRNDATMARTYNLLFTQAIMDGYDFVVQAQDDVRFETPMWDRHMGAFLCVNALCMGAYSAQDRFEPTRYTNTMVSRTHFDVFGFFVAEDAPDMSTWFEKVFGGRAQVLKKCKVTNTIRKTRRRRNGTEHVYEGYGTVDETVIKRDSDHFTTMLRSVK